MEIKIDNNIITESFLAMPCNFDGNLLDDTLYYSDLGNL